MKLSRLDYLHKDNDIMYYKLYEIVHLNMQIGHYIEIYIPEFA